jgi:Ca-activated chloride channel family protein
MYNLICRLPAALLTVIAFAAPALAQSTSIEIDSATRINKANELVREGKYVEAIEGYREIRSAESTRDQLNHNLAVAQFRNGDVEAAKTLFRDSAASSDSSLASRSRYNLGNCFYSDAVKQAERDKPAAIESLRESISHYRGSLAGNPNNADARANIELAVEMIRKLKEQQQEQQKEQQQQQQQESSDENQSDQQQDNQQQQGQQNSESQHQEPNQNESEQGDQQDQSDSPESKGNESKADPMENKDNKSGEPSSQSQSADQSPEQPTEQPKPSEQNSNDQPSDDQSQHQVMQSRTGNQQQADEPTSKEDSAATEQAVPAGELTAADQQQASDKPRGQVATSDPNAKDGLMTKQEALKMLQAVRDRDMLRRLRQEQEQRSRRVRVDRDW